MTLAMYEAVVVTLILAVEIYDIYLTHKRAQRQRMQRKVRKVLHSIGL